VLVVLVIVVLAAVAYWVARSRAGAAGQAYFISGAAPCLDSGWRACAMFGT
jgi:hypothetical protein